MVWSLRHLPDELRTIGTLMTLHHIWGRIDQTASSYHRAKRLVVVDEAWLLMRDGKVRGFCPGWRRRPANATPA